MAGIVTFKSNGDRQKVQQNNNAAGINRAEEQNVRAVVKI